MKNYANSLLMPIYPMDRSGVYNHERKESNTIVGKDGIPIDPDYDGQHLIREHCVDVNRWPNPKKGGMSNGVKLELGIPVYIFRSGMVYRRPCLDSAVEMFGKHVRDRLAGRVSNSTKRWVMYERDYLLCDKNEKGEVVPIQYGQID